MARTQTAETPPRRRALAVVPDSPLAPAKRAKGAASPRPTRTPRPAPRAPRESSSALLALYSKYLEKKPPAKRAAANAELAKSLAGIRDELDEILLCVGPIFAFCVAALSEAVSQAYGATGSGKLVPLRERYERIVATPMRPTSRRAWAAFHAHADIDDLRTILRTIPKTDDDGTLAEGIAALNQALSATYAAAEKSPE